MVTRYVFQADRHYKEFRVGKRSGHGFRLICAPSRALKGIQRWITTFILRRVDLHVASTAFRKGCSITRNARAHVGAGFVLRADIRDFFPSITTPRVVGLFKSLGYKGDVAAALGRLTTYRGRLPQGAPSSPDIANVICRGLDKRLSGFCKVRGWRYTRYCDDIAISGPGLIGRRVVARIGAIVREEGFELNARKTHVTRRNFRQVVTGLTVNEKLSIPRHRRKVLRAIFHQAKLRPERFVGRAAELQGLIAFLHMVDPDCTQLKEYRRVLRTVLGPLSLAPLRSLCYWRLGAMNETKGMLIKGQIHVTNTGARTIRLLSVRLVDPPSEGTVRLESEEGEVWPELPPGSSAVADAHFFVAPPSRAEGDDFTSDLVLADNFGVKHRCRGVLFQGRL